jgi:hypothetical protein
MNIKYIIIVMLNEICEINKFKYWFFNIYFVLYIELNVKK